MPGERIVQAWRTVEFAEAEPDSRLELLFEEVDVGCRIRITHSELPKHGMQYRQGWIEHYFEPMKAHFGRR